MVISMLKIRRPLGRLIFNMGIAIPGKTVFLIETAPRQPPLYTITKYHPRSPFIRIYNETRLYVNNGERDTACDIKMLATAIDYGSLSHGINI